MNTSSEAGQQLSQLAQALSKRFELTEQIAAYKLYNQGPLHVPKVETALWDELNETLTIRPDQIAPLQSTFNALLELSITSQKQWQSNHQGQGHDQNSAQLENLRMQIRELTRQILEIVISINGNPETVRSEWAATIIDHWHCESLTEQQKEQFITKLFW